MIIPVKQAASVAFVAFCAIAVFALAVRYPFHNWDIIGYTATVHYMDGLRGDELRLTTYEDIRQEVGEAVFQEMITEAVPYRLAVYTDTRAFEQQLPFYTIRAGYAACVKLVSEALGLTYPESTYYVSAFFGALSVVFFALLINIWHLPVWLLPPVIVLTGLPLLASASTPDIAASCVALWAGWWLLKGCRWFVLPVVLLPLFRTDFVIFSIFASMIAFVFISRRYALMSALGAVIAVVVLNRLAGNYGYLTIMDFTLISGPVPYPAEMVPSVRLWDYLRLYIQALRDPVLLLHIVFYGVVLYFAVLAAVRKRLTKDDLYMLAAIAYVIVHMLLFPLYEQGRFFIFVLGSAMLYLAALVCRGRQPQ